MIELQNQYKLIPQSESRYTIITGGRGSGKSFNITTLILLLTLEDGHTILFTRYTLKSAHISIIPEFLEKIDLLDLRSMFYITKDEIINVQSGSKILFRGIKTSSGDQTANLKSLQGVSTWVLDEAEELTDESIFDKIDLSIRHKDLPNRVFMIMNPATKEHFVYRRFYEDKGVREGSNLTKNDTTYIHTTYKDNIKHLSDSFLQQANVMKERRPERYNHIMLGGWLNKAEGVIFQNWTLGDFAPHMSSIFGQDYGMTDPTTLVEVSIDTSNKLIYLKECFYKYNLTTSEIRALNRQYAGRSLIIADSAEKRLITELKSDLNIKGIKKTTVVEGITIMQDYDLIVDPNSKNLIKELNNYVWLDTKSNTPKDNGFDHLIDAARYAITYQLKNPNYGSYAVR